MPQPAVETVEDVQAVWSSDLQSVVTAPVRDAIQQGQLGSLVAYSDATDYAAAQSDSTRATGEYLDEIGSYERGINRAAGEEDGPYRARVNGFPGVADPNDVLTAVNAILAPFTSVKAVYYEPLDGVFASNPSTTTWSNHAFLDADAGTFATPNYPDRFYSAIQNRRPKGHCAFVGGGRLFVLRLPDVSAVDATVSAAYQLGAAVTLTQVAQDFEVVSATLSTTISVRDLAPLASVAAFVIYAIIGGVPTNVGTFALTEILGDARILIETLSLNVSSSTIVPAGSSIAVTILPETPSGGGGNFAGNPSDGINGQAVTFAWSFNGTSDNVYQSIVDAVEAIRGHSIRWTLITDANLT